LITAVYLLLLYLMTFSFDLIHDSSPMNRAATRNSKDSERGRLRQWRQTTPFNIQNFMLLLGLRIAVRLKYSKQCETRAMSMELQWFDPDSTTKIRQPRILIFSCEKVGTHPVQKAINARNTGE
jgi:hypothetical protein